MAGFSQVAERTGLEPATSGVTGQHSNRLNYRSMKLSTQRPMTRPFGALLVGELVGAEGFEPPTLSV